MIISEHTYQDNGFQDILLPSNFNYSSSGGPAFRTSVNIAASGKEQRNSQWRDPRMQYSIGYECCSPDQISELISFFRIVKGRAKSFKLLDWADNSAQDQTLEPCPSNNRWFHFTKTYNFLTQNVRRRIFKPDEFEIWVEVAGIKAEPSFTVDRNIGVVIFSEDLPPNSVVKSNFKFYVPVRLDSDYLEISLKSYKNYQCSAIKLFEVRLQDNCQQNNGKL